MRRNFEIRPRRAATGPIQFQQVPVGDVLEQADELARFAMSLLAENEHRLLQLGHDVPFGRWLSGRTASRVQDRVALLVKAAADIRLRADLTSTVFTTTKSFAAHANVERTRLLADLAPRAQLLAALMAAGFAVDGLLGPVGAYLLFADGGAAGRNAHAFGIHNVDGESAFSRIVGVAALGPDTCVPVTAHALVAGMPLDGASVMRGREAMGEWLLELPTNLADHVSHSLQVINAARQVVHEAVDGSQACGAAGVRPSHMLDVGFSRWVLLGSLQVGPKVPGTRASGRRVYPGLEADVLQAATAQRFHPLAHAGDLTLSGPMVEAAEPAIVYAAGGRMWQGGRVVHALLTSDRDTLPALRELSEPQLRSIEEHARRERIPCVISARYLVLPRGLFLTGGDGAVLRVSGLVRIGPHATTLWTTTLDLAKPDAVAGAVARAELHVRSIEDRALNLGIKDYFADHEVHRLQAESYKTHTAMRIVTMLANLAAVGVARDHQTGRGPTH